MRKNCRPKPGPDDGQIGWAKRKTVGRVKRMTMLAYSTVSRNNSDISLSSP